MPPASARELIDMLHAPSPSTRLRALEAATHRGRTNPLLPPPDVASRRPRGRGQEEEEELRSVLANCLKRDSDPACRAKAMRTLAALSPVGDVECVSIALSKLGDKRHNDVDMRLAAADCISRTARTGDPAVLRTLIAHLDEDGQQRNPMENSSKARQDNVVRIALVRALGALVPEGGGGEALRVTACLVEVGGRDWDPEVREAARNVLVSMGRDELVADLK